MPVLLNFSKIGEGEPLIILHGLFGSSSNWRSIAKALASQFTVYTLDARNHGHSPWTETMSYTDMADDIAHFMDANEIAKAHVLGHSMGGKTAMCLALSDPKRINKLIVADIAPKSYSHANEHQRYIEAMLDINLEQLSHGRKEVEQTLTQTLAQPQAIIHFLLQNLNFKNEYFSWRINLPVILSSLPGIMAGIEVPDAGSNDIDCMFIYGEKSDYILDEDHKNIRNLFPLAKFSAMAGAGHWLHAEQPKLFIDTVKGFLNEDSVNI